jgi:ribosome maturation factor RimP
MKQAPQHLIELIEPIVTGLGYEYVGIVYNPHPQKALLRIYIDHEQGILLENCTQVSHQISGIMAVENLISTHYQLEISSPGDDRPLFTVAQFKRFIGHVVAINLYNLIAKRRKMTGLINNVEGNIIFLQEQKKIFEIPFKAMSKASLVPPYLLKKRGRNVK